MKWVQCASEFFSKFDKNTLRWQKKLRIVQSRRICGACDSLFCNAIALARASHLQQMQRIFLSTAIIESVGAELHNTKSPEHNSVVTPRRCILAFFESETESCAMQNNSVNQDERHNSFMAHSGLLPLQSRGGGDGCFHYYYYHAAR